MPYGWYKKGKFISSDNGKKYLKKYDGSYAGHGVCGGCGCCGACGGYGGNGEYGPYGGCSEYGAENGYAYPYYIQNPAAGGSPPIFGARFYYLPAPQQYF